VLDTYTLIWWVSGDTVQLSAAATDIIRGSVEELPKMSKGKFGAFTLGNFDVSATYWPMCWPFQIQYFSLLSHFKDHCHHANKSTISTWDSHAFCFRVSRCINGLWWWGR
jgi:hypothetical protein